MPKATPEKPQRTLRLRKQLLNYNLIKAFKKASLGQEPFIEVESDIQDTSLNLSWDYLNTTSLNPVNQVDISIMDDLNTTTSSFTSQMTTTSSLEDKIRSDPEAFSRQCQRSVKILVSYIPAQEIIQNIGSENIGKIITNVRRGLGKIERYTAVLESYLEDDDTNVETEQLRNHSGKFAY